MRRITLIGLPMYTLSRYSGMAAAQTALRKAGIVSLFEAGSADLGDVGLPGIKRDRGPAKMKNAKRFIAGTERIRRSVGRIAGEEMVLALGGECSLMIGELAGLRNRRKGKPGLVWIDSHGDFNIPETTPSGYIGGMCLAFACGRGPKLSAAVDCRMPLVDEEKLIHLGARALDETEQQMMEDSPMKLVSMENLRKTGIERMAKQTVKMVEDSADWIVCHLDVDVMDPSLIPSVNYPVNGGLTIEETVQILRPLVRTQRLAALDIAAYNASLDPGGESARAIVGLLSKVFA